MNNRPLSPHLQIYKIQVTSFFSGMHRITGILLFCLLIAVSWCYILHTWVPDLFIVSYLHTLSSSFFAKLFYLFCFIILTYHFLNGIRYLLWDVGIGLGITSVLVSATVLMLVLLFSSVIFYFNI
ncbi:succinate dehydrogenase, cytochrome b556 subunit [Wolbachia pipientis]|uniref:Succinate dehydrogenase cytochrome b556 subunit n=2 Tax=Wolbachia pipientis TaxID=955 RepID=A0A1E7QJJ2_WOLPI|nr:succinate dehydrogenase, cytochrome b556 subunit [Wolbachia pipientis]